MDEIIANPQLIEPMAPKLFKSQEDNHKNYLKIKKDVDQHLGEVYPNAELVSYNGNTYAVLDHNQEKIVYFMQFKFRTILGRQAAYQIIVWSDPFTQEIRGYAPKVFFEHLFAKTKLICTDQQQTFAGQRFWMSVVGAAIDRGLYVYFLDQSQKPNIKAWIISRSKLEEYDKAGLVWTTKESGKKKYLLISETEIPELK